MKKIIIFILLFAGIFFTSCGGKSTNSNTNANLQISQSTNKWECVGTVYPVRLEGNCGLHYDISGEIKVYVKQIGGQHYYKLGTGETVYPNPNYGSSDRTGKYRYLMSPEKGTIYGINL